MPNLGIEVGNIWGLNDVLSNDFMGFHMEITTSRKHIGILWETNKEKMFYYDLMAFTNYN
jgi:hypothetical protein